MSLSAAGQKSCDNAGANQQESSSTIPSELNTFLKKLGYSMGGVIGKGAYSKVRLCPRHSGDGFCLACKVVSKSKGLKFLPRELETLSRVKHPNIVKFYDFMEFPTEIYIFMEFCANGDLFMEIEKRGFFQESQGQHVFRQILAAIQYLHGLDIAHRDLKCENVLLTTQGEVKLSDFGFSRYCRDSKGESILSRTFCGTHAYCAPEILQKKPYNPKVSDMWSLGCILFYMLTKHMAFGHTILQNLMLSQMERNYNYPEQLKEVISESAKGLIRDLLEPDVTQRASIEQAISHSWVSSHSDNI